VCAAVVDGRKSLGMENVFFESGITSNSVANVFFHNKRLYCFSSLRVNNNKR